jgi:hypothetical protein
VTEDRADTVQARAGRATPAAVGGCMCNLYSSRGDERAAQVGRMPSSERGAGRSNKGKLSTDAKGEMGAVYKVQLLLGTAGNL